MPTYSYRCTECDNAFDIHQAFTDDSLTTCQVCGGRLRKVFTAIGVSFTGSGFYRNDSRAPEKSRSGDGSSSDGGSGSSDSSAPSSSDSASGAGSDKATAPSGAKPDTTKPTKDSSAKTPASSASSAPASKG